MQISDLSKPGLPASFNFVCEANAQKPIVEYAARKVRQVSVPGIQIIWKDDSGIRRGVYYLSEDRTRWIYSHEV